MIEEGLSKFDIYRRKKNLKLETHSYSYGFNCEDESRFLEVVLLPVIEELDNLEEILQKIDDELAATKQVLKDAGMRVSMINPKDDIQRSVSKWERY